MSELKSIMWSSWCSIISLLFLIASMTAVFAINDASFRKQIINELPTKRDFEYYFAGLERAVDFFLRHTVYLDADMEFGLFMVDVNLRELVEQKRSSLSKNKLFHLENLLIKINALAKFFHKMVHKHEDEADMEQERKLPQMFYNKTTWSSPSVKFNQDLLKQTKVFSPDMLEKMYGKWNKYVVFAVDAKKFVPTIEDSDECISQLELNPVHNPALQGICDIPDECKDALAIGSDYGNGLLHRTLIMVIARFSRDCYVVSRQADRFQTDTFCMMSFNEAEYNALNRFEIPDLMFGQIALCGLLGHAQFIRNYWIKSLLQYQTQEGCFTQRLATGEFNENLLREGSEETWKLINPSIMNGQCDGHFTSVAVAALANALRYIIETYY